MLICYPHDSISSIYQLVFEQLGVVLSRFSTWRICSREQAKNECDWLVMTSVFVASQSRCFYLCSREQIRQVENRLYMANPVFHVTKTTI